MVNDCTSNHNAPARYLVPLYKIIRKAESERTRGKTSQMLEIRHQPVKLSCSAEAFLEGLHSIRLFKHFEFGKVICPIYFARCPATHKSTEHILYTLNHRPSKF